MQGCRFNNKKDLRRDFSIKSRKPGQAHRSRSPADREGRCIVTFANAQPLYAEHGIATFPVTAAKKPAVQGYLHTGLNSSRSLAN